MNGQKLKKSSYVGAEHPMAVQEVHRHHHRQAMVSVNIIILHELWFHCIWPLKFTTSNIFNILSCAPPASPLEYNDEVEHLLYGSVLTANSSQRYLSKKQNNSSLLVKCLMKSAKQSHEKHNLSEITSRKYE